MRISAFGKELRLRIFTLRVLLAIHADKALLSTMRGAKAGLPRIRRLAQAAWQAAWKALMQILRATGRATRYAFRRFLLPSLPVLFKAMRTSAGFLRKGYLRHPRPLVGGALVALSLLSLVLVEPQRAEKNATATSEGSAQKTIVAPKARLSLLPQVLRSDQPRQRQQASLPSRTEYRVLEHSVRSSLYETALTHGIALPLLRRFVDVMSYDVDFQREIWAGARFRMLLSQQFRLAEGGAWQPLGEPVLEVAELYTGRKEYRYHRSGWNDAFYDEDGKPAKRLLRRTPMSGLRLTSRFGLRKHPILGYTRMHKGVDFAAPRGTPILAAGDGVVRKRSYGKGYGRYVLLQHSDRLSTLYAHMRGFARGLRKGARVKQGQVIGYVGSSGMSTGAHLHYEIHRDGRAVNPRRVTLPKPKFLEESKRREFSEKRREDEAWLARGGSFPQTDAIAALRALGCEVWGGMCDGARRAQK